MSIEQYKESLITILEDMEKEHGCKVSTVMIERSEEHVGQYTSISYHVDIML